MLTDDDYREYDEWIERYDLLDESSMFHIENECEIFCEDLRILTLFTDHLFTGEYQKQQKIPASILNAFMKPEPDGYRIGDGGRIIPNG